MGIIDRAKNLWKFSKELRSVGVAGGFFESMFNAINSTDEVVNENTAMRVATVSACLKVLGEDIAALPKSIMRREGDKRYKQNSKLNYLISTKPNPRMTAYNWSFAMVVGAAGWGESYAPVIKDRNGKVESLEIIPPWEMKRLPMQDGSIYFGHGQKMYHPDDVITLRPFTVDGVNPLSIIRYNAETIGFALKSQKYRGKVFNVKPPGYLSSELPLNGTDQQKAISDQWKGQVTGGTPVLWGGMKYHPLSFSPADLQLLEANRATKEDVCALFRMPPIFVQDYSRSTFANAEQQGIVYKTYTLNPFITNFSQEIDSKCFNDNNQLSKTPEYVNFNLNGLLQGDFKTRTEGYRTLWQMGAITANTVMALEDMNPIEGGDKAYVPMNMISTDQTEKFYDKLSAPANAKQTSTEDRAAFMSELSSLIKMNGYNHTEHHA